jgi:tetratricopeptide (TPR) repeat protein
MLSCDVLALAARFQRFGGLVQAEQLYRQVLHEQPDRADAWAGLGEVCHTLGRRDEAAHSYRRSLELDPESVRVRNRLGVVLQELGRLDEAIVCFREALRLQADTAESHNHLGIALLRQGRIEEAVAAVREALRLEPASAAAHDSLGQALAAQGCLAEAANSYRQAVETQPGFRQAWFNLGEVLGVLGRADEAAACYDRAWRLRPDDPAPLTALGTLRLGQGRTEAAVVCFEQALRLRPDAAEACNNLGVALLRQGRLGQGHLQPGRVAEAALSFQQALYLQPNRAEVHVNLGLARVDQGRQEEAVLHFQQALHIRPDLAEAHLQLGLARAARGRMDEALAAVREAYRLDPDHALTIATLSQLAALGRHRFGADEVCRFQELAAREHLPLEDRCHLFFALTWLHDRAGDYAAAFECCRRAEELRREFDRRRGAPFGPAEQDRYLDQFRAAVDGRIAAFTPAHFARTASFGLDTKLPIFIVGMPRSGTTLVEQILASHPRVHGAGEVLQLERSGSVLSERLGKAHTDLEQLSQVDARAIRELAEAVLQLLRQRADGADRVVEKTPQNFLAVGLLATLFPRARIVHCRRHPADTCLSNYFQSTQSILLKTLDLRHLGLYYREYERLMAHWNRVLPMPIFELHYEEMTADQEGTSRRLLAFCDLEWHERCLRFHDRPQVAPTPSLLQVRQPVYRSAVGRWKHYEGQLRPLLEALSEK